MAANCSSSVGRFALKIIELSEKRDDEYLIDFLKIGSVRLYDWFNRLCSDKNYFKEVFNQESDGWNTYYSLLNIAEELLNEEDEFIIQLQDKAKIVIERCQLKFDDN